MLIKEYRIPLPLTVEEYRIAQLYMIQKKSREESEGEGSGVEILENRPYTDGPNGSGQYTYKIYHIGRHLPSWFRSIAPKTALEVHEESWNAYPYTKTKFSVPFVDKFSLEVETYFEPDGGTQENIFKLKAADLRQRELDVIDIVNDHLSGSDYKKEEDPKLFVSEKTGRGPLRDDWIANPPGGRIMCSYKLIKVNFKYWGLQSKIERFIHDYGLRRVMLRAHRQAWAWQDEWDGLTIDDIRRLERETQVILQRKLGRVMEDEVEEETDKQDQEVSVSVESKREADSVSRTSSVSTPNSVLEASTRAAKHQKVTREASQKSQTSGNVSPRDIRVGSFRRVRSGTRPGSKTGSHTHQQSADGAGIGKNNSIEPSFSTGTLDIPRRQSSLSVFRSTSLGCEDDEGNVYYSTARPEWGFDQIAMESDSESDLEFFDAKERISDDEEEGPSAAVTPPTQRRPHPPSSLPTHVPHPASQTSAGGNKAPKLSVESPDERSGAASPRRNQFASAVSNSFDLSGDEGGTPAVFDSDVTLRAPSNGTADFLFLVFHGGSTLVSQMDKVNKTLDFQALQNHLINVTDLHYHSAVGRVALRLIPCPTVCNPAHKTLCQLSPIPVSQQRYGEGVLPTDPQKSRGPSTSKPPDQPSMTRDYSYSIPLGAIPLLATEFHGYSDVLKKVASKANQVYQEFLKSEEGRNFSGQVCILGDCMGSVLAYDILTSMQTCPSPSPLSPSSPSISPPPAPPTCSISNGNDLTVCHTGERGRRKFLTTPSSSKQNASAMRRSPLLSIQRKERSFDSATCSLSSSNTSINIIDLDEHSVNFSFPVTNFFAFGSPLGLVLASRRTRNRAMDEGSLPRPNCTTFYNLFYSIDPVASRLEPLLDERFAEIGPISVPSYRLYPTGMAKADSLKETVVRYPYLFGSKGLSVPRSYLTAGSEGGVAEATGGGALNRKKAISSECLHLISTNDTTRSRRDTSREEIKPFSVWWSANRIDYSLEAPRDLDGATLLPLPAFSHVIHSRYWEAKELVSFILRQVLHHESVFVRKTRDSGGEEETPFLPQESVVKWNKKSTAIKIQHLSSNHRAQDVVALDSSQTLPTITAKFQYGPLAMASLSKELIEVYLLSQGVSWRPVGSELTDKHGKLSFTLPDEERLPPGLYPVKFLVKGDHTTASCNLFVVPPHIEAVVFSVDGALASNFSLSAKDIRLKQSAVDVARYWQELGYLIIYITGRPDVQKDYVLSFLGAHGFPLGVVACAETLSADSQSLKTLFLARLIKEAKMIIHAGYGSQRHLGVYMELGLQPDQIYIISRKQKSTSKRLCQYLLEGFDSHLMELKSNPPKRAMYDVRSLTGEACFALPGKLKPEEANRRRPFSKRFQRSSSTETQATHGSTKQGKASNTSRQSPGPQTERYVQ